MKRIALAALALSSCAITALAQTAPTTVPPATAPSSTATPAVTGPGNSAVKDPNAPAKPGASPISGANSFTEGQAQSRIEARGFSAVTNLKKDNAGVWRATATKDGKQHSVGVDFQGNVVTR